MKFGQTLLANPGTWSPDVSLTYVWKRDGIVIPEENSATYSLTSEDLGKKISVETTGTLAGYVTVTKKSATTAVVAPLNFTEFPAPTISGVAQVGEVLRASADAWTPEAEQITYAWRYVGSSTVLGTESTYEILDGDLGKALTVTVTGTKDGYFTRSIRSSATSRVTPQ